MGLQQLVVVHAFLSASDAKHAYHAHLDSQILKGHLQRTI